MNKNPFQDILVRTSHDKKFREQFLRDPEGVLRQAGIQVPHGKTIKVLEHSDERMYIVIPTSLRDQPANWNRRERPAPGAKREVPGLVMEWTEAGLALSGRIDSASAPALRDELERVSGNLLLDFSKVFFMSSAGLSVLLAARKRLQANEKGIALCGVSEEIMGVFTLTNTDALFSFYDPKDMAGLASWGLAT